MYLVALIAAVVAIIVFLLGAVPVRSRNAGTVLLGSTPLGLALLTFAWIAQLYQWGQLVS